ncbi:hypothetical protein [Paraburkholderia sp. SIMBA_054]|uniref:hypothetical protein n=1 Tax=Paraburkholderia sp. SIMBA_054 TaxID=3085795 RepID=UPI00397E6279
MKKTKTVGLLLQVTLAASVAAHAGEAVTVDHARFEASVVCSDGHIAVTHHASVLVPQGDDHQFFSPHGRLTDPYSIAWVIRSTCSARSDAVARFDVQNITDTGFLVKGTVGDGAYDGADFAVQVVSDQTTVPLGEGARLVVRRVALDKRTYPDANEAIRAARAAAPHID